MSVAQTDRLTGRGTPAAAPASTGQKFTASGEALRCPGNTFLCPIPPETPAHAALTRAQDALRAGPHASAYRFLPPDSFHMTVFEGVIDYRRGGDAWPEGLDSSTPVDAVTETFAARCDGAKLPATAGLAVCPRGLFGGYSVQVSGATDADEAALRALRARLRDLTGISRADFDRYAFHITLAYPLRWLTEDEAATIVALSDAILAGLCAAAPTIPLSTTAFCRFDDMLAFVPLRTL